MKIFEKHIVCPPDEIIPLTTTAEHFPQGSADRLEIPLHLAEYGYIEEEFLIRSHCNLYTWPDPGDVPVIRVEAAPCATRLLVRKPADPERFSGCVMLEAFNTATGIDHASSGWGFCHEEILAAGDAWIGYTLGRDGIGFDALERFDPARYDVGLGFPNPIPLEQRKDRGFCIIRDRPANEGNASHELETPDNVGFDRGLAHDLFYQMGSMAKSGREDSPLAGYSVKAVFGVGVHMFNTYVAAFKDGKIMPDGSQVIDGYLMYMSGSGLGLSREDDMIKPEDPRAKATAAVPIIKVETSGDLRGAGGHPCWGVLWRGTDSDEPGRQTRWYEIPGTGVSHDAGPGRSSWPGAEDYAKAGVPRPVIHRNRIFNPMPRMIMAGAYRNLKSWVLEGLPPPRAAAFIETRGERPDTVFVTDQPGNQIGGVRHPYVDVPVAAYDDLGGVTLFDRETLTSLYRSGADYVARVAEQAKRLATDRWILPEAAADLISLAREIAGWLFASDGESHNPANEPDTAEVDGDAKIWRQNTEINLTPGLSLDRKDHIDMSREIFNRRIPGSDTNAHILGRYPDHQVKQLIPEYPSSWYEYVPEGLDPAEPLPLVLSRHGGIDGGLWQSYVTSWNCLADRERFIVAYPDALWKERTAAGAAWPPWRGMPLHLAADAWQIREIQAIIDDIASRWPVDRTRIFMQGHSVGDLQTLQFALAAGGILAGLGESCGPIDAERYFGGDGKPVAHATFVPAIISYCSNNDMLSARPDGDPNRLLRKEMKNLQFWQSVNGAMKLPEIGIRGDENIALFRGEQADVLYHEIYGRSHSQPFDEAEMMWSCFFSSLRRRADGCITSCGATEDRSDKHAAAVADGCMHALVGNRKLPLDQQGSRIYAAEIPFTEVGDSLLPPVPAHLTRENTPGFHPVLYAPVEFLRHLGASVIITGKGQASLVNSTGDRLDVSAGNIGVVWNGRLRAMNRQAEMRDGVLFLPVKWAAQVFLNRFVSEQGGVLYINDRYGEMSENMAALITALLIE